MTSSEDVLYQINDVKHKKDVGTLYVMYERICWIQGNRDIVSVSHSYADIKSQKISSEGKPKIQLQIVLHENNQTFTFEFIDPGGPQKRIEARAKVVEYLRQVLPKYGRGRDNELMEKNRLLSENNTLFQLYKDLVTDGIVSPEEFWTVHAQQFLSKNKPTSIRQDVGISSGFLSGIQPLTDGSNGITYNLTPEVMEAIFKTYPAVRRKHFDCVPSQMTESEFWIKFFQSHYFHRDRLPTIQDLFSDCAKADDKEMRRALEKLKQQDTEVLHVLEDPGLQDDNKELLAATVDKKDQNSALGIHRSMIKRFNQHSIMLLNAYERNNAATSEPGSSKAESQEGKKSKKNAAATQAEPAAPTTAVVNGNHATTPPDDESDHPDLKKPKLDDFEDLHSETTQDFQKLNLTKIDRYLNGPIPDYKTDQVSAEHVSLTIQSMKDIAARWAGKTNTLDAKTAVNMLGELNPGGSMMKLNFSENAAQSLSTELETEIRNTYVALSELLRHFWSCFPPTTPALQEKLVKTHDTIKKFEQIKLQKVKDELKRDLHDPAMILGHIYSILEAANQKYSQWANRRK